MINGVFIIPTGLNCALGGDAAYLPGVKLISSCVDNLIVNPNAVNASDINEMPENALYVEGSTIDRFLEGKLNLHKVKTYNKILVVVNSITPLEINAMNAGIWGLGAHIRMIELNTPLNMTAIIDDGVAGGIYSGVDELINQVLSYNDFDALAIHTPIDCDDKADMNYWENGGVNPWGGIEAIVSKVISEKVNKPIAHAPRDVDTHNLMRTMVVKKTMAPEIISGAYIFSVYKGLHRAPRLEFNLSKSSSNILNNSDIDFLLSPHGCWGRPHEACRNKDIPIIVVKENTTCFSKNFTYEHNVIFVENYLEAAGLIMAMNSGMDYRELNNS